MLVVSRKEGEAIYIRSEEHPDQVIKISLLRIRSSNVVQVGIAAPDSYNIVREELLPPEERIEDRSTI